jgi:hypothetical protein
MKIFNSIKFHYDNKKYARLTRQVAKDCTEISDGYIVAYSKDFIILQETDDFRLLGYLVLPIAQIEEVRYNKVDKYYDKIMVWEKEADNVSLPYDIDLTNWNAIFKSIKSYKLNVIVECEDPEIDTFTIGPVVRITKNKVYISHFDAQGYIDEDPIAVEYADISKARFDERYANIFGKYTRHKKKK